MIGHDDMNGVFGSPAWHVAGDAILPPAFLMRSMTLQTCAFRGCLSQMWTMAGCTRELARAFQEACGLQQPVSRAVDFELIAASTPARVIELDDVVLQRFTGPVGKYISAEAA
jgi:hypothetical protein